MSHINPVLMQRQTGTSLIEVLVAMVVLAIGLLGLVGLQARLHVLQIESYQRAQALLLLHDMATRVALNRAANGSTNPAVNYVTASPLGAGMTCPATGSARKAADLADWCAGLQGAAETNGGNVGAMVGGRGCIHVLGPPSNLEYLITVAWQGMAPTNAPPAGITCGAGQYGAAGTPCAGELCRRVVTTIVRISTLT